MATPITAEISKAKLSLKLLIVGVVAMVLTAAWAIGGHRYSNNAIPYQAGTSLFISGLVWAVAYFGFLRKEPRTNIKRDLFLILFGVAFIVSLAMAHAPTVSSDMQKDRNDYQHEIAAIDAGSILDPSAVAADPTLAQAEFKAQRAVAIVAKYRNLASQRLAEAHNPGRTQALIEEEWSYEAQAADTELQTVNILIANRLKWTISDNKFTFYDKDLLNSYNAKIVAVQEIAKKGDAVRAELDASK